MRGEKSPPMLCFTVRDASVKIEVRGRREKYNFFHETLDSSAVFKYNHSCKVSFAGSTSVFLSALSSEGIVSNIFIYGH